MNKKEEKEKKKEEEKEEEEDDDDDDDDGMPLRCCLQRLYFSTQRRSKDLKGLEEKQGRREKKNMKCH